MTFQEKLQQVIDHNLCTRCGSCIGLGEGRIQFVDKTREYLPHFKEPPGESLAKDAWIACSGQEVNFPALDKYVFKGNGSHHPYFGTYLDLNIGYSTDPSVRQQGGSAGVISATLLWMLEKKLINGAVVLRMSMTEPWMPHSMIATTREDILSAAQSKYIISSTNELLPEMEKFDGLLAYVGLPCQVHSIRKLQMAGHPSVKNIRYIIAPYCGLNLHFSSIISFLRSHGERDYRNIKELKFREGEWPGNMKVELQDGKVFQLPKFHANYLIPLHMMDRCRYCIDVANEFADISVGDAWSPIYEERGKGFSIVIARSETGRKILSQMSTEGAVELIAASVEETVKMHSHMYDNKKRGAFIRIKRLHYKPDYNLPFPQNINQKRKIFEFIMNLILRILRTQFVIWAVDMMPPRLAGKIFNSFKVFWKRITFSVKRKDL